MSESELIKTFGRDVLQGKPLNNLSTDNDLQTNLLTDEEIDDLPKASYEEYPEYSPAFENEEDYSFYMEDYNDRKEQYEKYINSKKEQPVEQLEQAPVTITPEAINDFKEIIEEVKKLKNKMGKLTMNKMIDDIQTYYNNKETVNLIANLETLLKTIKDIDPLALENKEIFIEKIKQYTTNKNCQI
jgi:hypothetical protein